MAWYGWLIIGILSTSLVITIIMLIYYARKTSQPYLSKDEVNDLIKVEIDKSRKTSEVEQKGIEEIKKAYYDYKKSVDNLRISYEGALDKLSAEKKNEFEKYLKDTSAASARISRLLGVSSNDTESTSETGELVVPKWAED